MNQHFYTSDELDHILAKIKEHQHKDMLLRINEILSFLDTTSPAGKPLKAATKKIQFIEGHKFYTLAEAPSGAG